MPAALIQVEHTISLGHRLPSYDGICNSPHGHNARFQATLRVISGRFLDFKEVSNALRDVLEPLDHAMVLHVEDPLASALEHFGKELSGAPFRVVKLSVEPTTEALAQFVFNELWGYFPSEIEQVTCHETAKYSATVATGDVQTHRIL